ncbi:MAG: HupE/UreJ family protein [Gammaproteobacteria bacterium]
MQLRHGYTALVTLMVATASLSSSYAHTGTLQTNSLGYGLSHPFTGIDHLLAMLAVGVWAAQLGGQALWLVPLTFVTVMSISGVASMGAHALPLIEPGIVMSVLLLGILIMAMVRLPLAVGAGLVGVFAVFHGAAHGVEVPVAASGAAYAAGFVAATAFLHICGLLVGGLLAHVGRLELTRYVGGAVMLGGAYLALA